MFFDNWWLAVPWLVLVVGITVWVLRTPDGKTLLADVLRQASPPEEAKVDEAPNNS